MIELIEAIDAMGLSSKAFFILIIMLSMMTGATILDAIVKAMTR